MTNDHRMKHGLIGAAVISLLVPLIGALAQNVPAAPSGSVIAQMPCRFTTFEDQSAFTRRFYSKDEFETAKNSPSIDCLRIRYISDGLNVVGFLVKPRNSEGARYPVIVYNRGGLLDI